jgi:hypothetical protein
MVFRNFVRYIYFLIKKFKLRGFSLLLISIVNAFSDLLLLITISKILQSPVERIFGFTQTNIFLVALVIKFSGQLSFNYLLISTMTKINLYVISELFKNICTLPSLLIYSFNEDEYKGLTSFQVNQLNQIVLVPFIRVTSDIFVLFLVVYFLLQLSSSIFISLIFVIILYGIYLKYTNLKIRLNSEVIYEEFKGIVFFTENFFNGRLDFTSLVKRYNYENEIENIYTKHQFSTNINVFLSSLKKVVLELLVFGFLLLQMVFGNLELSELAILFFVLIRLIPIANNLNLFFSNLNLNKVTLFKVNNSVHGIF